jgi:tungstate transport system substrate-binding protein
MRRLTCAVIALTLMYALTPFGHAAGKKNKNVIFATTTSTQDTGLLDVLLPVFEKKTGFIIKTIAVGSGQAMALGERGEADVLLVHSPDAEKKFMRAGSGLNRRLVMHNDFVLVGPDRDTAGVRKAKTVVDAFRRIAAEKALFVSRGDNSGTHVAEQKIWKAAGVDQESQKWYQQTGLGMGKTISVVSEKGGYAMCDRSTYLSMKKVLALSVLFEGDERMKNIYHVIEVNPAKFKSVNGPGGSAFADFLVSPGAQKIIGEFGVDKYGSALFFPDAGKAE